MQYIFEKTVCPLCLSQATTPLSCEKIDDVMFCKLEEEHQGWHPQKRRGAQRYMPDWQHSLLLCRHKHVFRVGKNNKYTVYILYFGKETTKYYLVIYGT